MNKKDLIKIIREEIQSVLTELSTREIKSRIRQVLNLDDVQKYKVDDFNYKNIPFSIFELNGIMPADLKQYKQSNDIITYDLGISINPIKKHVNVFLQKSGIFNEDINKFFANGQRVKNKLTGNIGTITFVYPDAIRVVWDDYKKTAKKFNKIPTSIVYKNKTAREILELDFNE